MKTILTLSLFLFSLSAEAQSCKSSLIKTVDTINSILDQAKIVHITNQDYKLFYPTKINANLQGDVFCIESSTRLGTNLNGFIFNLLKTKSFVINENEIKAIGENNENIVTIFLGKSEYGYTLKKELSALRFICTQYSEQDPKFKCD